MSQSEPPPPTSGQTPPTSGQTPPTGGQSPAAGQGFGDFQANVGKVGAAFNEIGAWIAFGICAIISVFAMINALKDDPANPNKNKVTSSLIALIPFGFGLLILVLAHKWHKVVNHNRGAAQFAGMMTEGRMLSDVIHGPPSNGFDGGSGGNGFDAGFGVGGFGLHMHSGF